MGESLHLLGRQEQGLILLGARKLDALAGRERVASDQVLLDGRVEDGLQDRPVDVADDAGTRTLRLHLAEPGANSGLANPRNGYVIEEGNDVVTE